MRRLSLAWLPKTLTVLVAAAVVVLAMMWLSGAFRTGAIQPGKLAVPSGSTTRPLLTVETSPQPEQVDLIGTVQSEYRTTVSARLQANIVEMNVNAGSQVSKGQVIARLDDRDLKARLEQANEALRAAEAQRDLARRKAERFGRLVQEQAAGTEEWDDWKARYAAAAADATAAQQKIREVQVALSDAMILSPMDGIVVERLAESGDMAVPGKGLAVIYDPQNLRLEALVREAYIGRLDELRKKKQPIPVLIESIGKEVPGLVTQIVPLADPQSRSFVVKVHLSAATDLYPGMFGRLRVPLGEAPRTEIPQRAVREVGQLSLVTVAVDDHTEVRAVRLGRTRGDRVEVLAGLAAGDRIVLP